MLDGKLRESVTKPPAPKPASHLPVQASRENAFEPRSAPSRATWSRLGHAAPEADVETPSSPPRVYGPRFDFSRIPLTPPVQRKASISSPRDPDEVEADEVADEVMRMAEPAPIGSAPASIQRAPLTTQAASLQRKCTACEQNEEEDERRIQRKSVSGAPAISADVPSIVDQALRSDTGRPLDAASQAYFAPRLGFDLSTVRIHTHSRSAESARALKASAYTVGHHIVFGEGHYSPGTSTGKRLLAHELVHVGQQSRVPRAGVIQRQFDDDTQAQNSAHAPVAADTLSLRIGVTLGHEIGVTAQDNLVRDALPALERLLQLWAIDVPTFNTTAAAWRKLGLDAQLTGPDLLVLRTAIMRGLEPSLANEVANNYLGLDLPPGRGIGSGSGVQNVESDVTAVQHEMLARKHILSISTPGKIDQETRSGIVRLKRMVAEGTWGWKPLRSEEIELGGLDKYAGRTRMSGIFSVFVPPALHSDKNFVHVFFSPNDVDSDSKNGSDIGVGHNSILAQGLRSAAADTKWILIGVPLRTTISMAQIQGCLERAGRKSTAIEEIHLSAHSRGWWGLVNSLKNDSEGRALLDGNKVKKRTILDAGNQEFVTELQKANIDPKGMTFYDVTVPNKLDAPAKKLTPACVQAIGYVRLVRDAIARGEVNPPKNVMALVNALPLPPRGAFTTKKQEDAPGKVNIDTFCRQHAAAIAEIEKFQTGLFWYVNKNNLAKLHPKVIEGRISDETNARIWFGTEAHHWWLAEFAHEILNP
ncbi:DUF4157 domain-containing protein [Polyangium fumosum]|uniref:DUF4157 domain-containing protein n=1 Tax=Polyangium fumosum TaxID=889272 RepID=A0A4V5PND2_9BACT|nr:DUF4157 domain-containing protein [Polyangium fumosum]TKC99766.1 DUF4157 domain-containing protein [Polyangium fumosum]